MLNSLMNKEMILMALVALLIGFSFYLYTETRWLKSSLYALEDGVRSMPIPVDEEPNKEEETEEINGSADA